MAEKSVQYETKKSMMAIGEWIVILILSTN
jgi:hypothetical protein